MLLRVTLSAQSKGCLEGGGEETHGHGRLKQEDTCLGSVSAAHCTVWVWREAPGLLPLHREGVAGLQTWVLPVSAHGEGSLLGLLFQQFGESTPFGSQQDNEKPRGGARGCCCGTVPAIVDAWVGLAPPCSLYLCCWVCVPLSPSLWRLHLPGRLPFK